MRWRLITVHMLESDKKLASVLLGRLGKEVSTSKGKVTATSVYSSSIYGKLRVCATWPAVAKKLVNGQITLGKSEMLKWGVFAEGKTRKENSRASNREPSIRSLPVWDARHMTAPKFVQLRVILESDQRDYYGKKAKDVILCMRNESAYLLHKVCFPCLSHPS